MHLSTVLRILGSRRLAMALLLSWAALIVVWVIPFEFYGLPDTQIRTMVYQEPFFRLVYIVLAVNTIACLTVHAATVLRRVTATPSADSRPSVSSEGRSVVIQGQDEVARRLERAGYRTQAVGEGWTWAVRNRFSPLGTLLYHVGIVLSIVGIAMAFTPALRFEGSLVLAEGETYSGDSALYIDKPADATAEAPSLDFTVNKVTPQFYQDILLFTSLQADVTTGAAHKMIALSHPWIPRADTLVNLSDFGYALEVAARSTETTAQTLQVQKLKAFPSGQMDVIEVPVGTDTYRVYVRVYGDYVDRGGQPGVKSFNSDNPYLMVSVARALSAGGERMLVTDQVVRIGDSVEVPGATLAFPGLRHYGVFRVLKNPAAPLVAVALMLMVIGTVWRLVLPRTEVVVSTFGEAASSRSMVQVRSDFYGWRPTVAKRIARLLEVR